MTPPLPLAELVKKWRTRAAIDVLDEACVEVDRCADELEAALPLGRCETCREFEGRPQGYADSHRGSCNRLRIGVTRQFGCVYHATVETTHGQ